MTGFYMKGNAELNWVKSGVYVSINMQCLPDYFRTRRNIKILYKNLQSTKRTKKYIVRVKSKIQNNKYKEVNLDNIQRSSYRQKIILRYQKDTKK